MPSRRLYSTARQILIKTDRTVRAALLDAFDQAGEDMISSARQATSDWTHKPQFQKRTEISPSLLIVTVFPTGRNATIFTWVDQGTEGPYTIPKFPRQWPKRKLLKFRGGYSARTAPIAKSNQGTGRASGAWVSKLQVRHPGIRARKFLLTFSEELRPPLNRRVNNEIRRRLR